MVLSLELCSDNLLTENNSKDNGNTTKSDYFQFLSISNVNLLFATEVKVIISILPVVSCQSLVCTILLRFYHFYRPHPKDGEGNVFTGICPSTGGGGGYPLPGSFPGLWSQVLSQVADTPVPARGIPPGQEWGTDPGQDWGTPLTRTGLGYPLPSRQNSRVSTCCAAGGMPLVVMQEDFLFFGVMLLYFTILTLCITISIYSMLFLKLLELTKITFLKI